MSEYARKHHFIPQLYLRGFAKRVKKKFQLGVFDVKRSNYFCTSPQNIAAVRDFNRINVQDTPPDQIEKMMSYAETEYAEAIKAIQNTDQFEGKNKDLVLELMALLAVRNPTMRSNMTDFLGEIIKTSGKMFARNSHAWQKIVEKVKGEEGAFNSKITEDQMRESFLQGKYDVEICTERHLQNEFQMVPTVYELLQLRNWTLVIASESGGFFVTCDNPVMLCWENPEKIPPILRHSPGFGLKKTIAYFTLSKTHALVGKFEGIESKSLANKQLTAAINTIIMNAVDCQLYTTPSGFNFIDGNDEILHSDCLREGFKKRR